MFLLLVLAPLQATLTALSPSELIQSPAGLCTMQDQKGLIICSCCTPRLSHCLLFRPSQTPTAHTWFLVVSPGRPAPSAQSRLEELSADDRWQQQGLCSGKRKTKLEALWHRRAAPTPGCRAAMRFCGRGGNRNLINQPHWR